MRFNVAAILNLSRNVLDRPDSIAENVARDQAVPSIAGLGPRTGVERFRLARNPPILVHLGDVDVDLHTTGVLVDDLEEILVPPSGIRSIASGSSNRDVLSERRP